MSTATMQSTPAIPPRPSRSHDSSSTTATAGSTPSIPPRPNRFRSVSPNPDRFAPSPLNEGFNPPKSHRLSATFTPSSLGVTSQSTTDLDNMGPGEEGAEYAAYGANNDGGEELTRQSSASPEQTRTIGEDIKLHAPKPTMPAQSAKQRVAQVTRTDSDRAAAFGIGRPSSTDQHNPPRTLRKKASTASQLSQGSHYDDDGGIPEIGIQVPMYPHAGDVQAPSPAPGAIGTAPGTPGQRNHHRKRSSRGFNELPPGSYGLHGHGVVPSDKLEKAYYEKHPELLQKEHYKYLQDRPTDFSMSSEDLNKIVRGEATAPSENYTGTPSEQVGYQAAEEYASRLSRPPSAAAKDITSPIRPSFGRAASSADDDEVIHVSDRGHHRGVLKYGENEPATVDNEEGYEAPILASDEVAKRSSQYELYPAVDPPTERRGSAYEMERPRSITGSRPSSIYSPPPADVHSTSLDDVEEYEPLFPEDEQGNKIPLSAAQLQKIRQRFPSRDIWEDAPDSVHGTAEVSTPEAVESAAQRPAGQPLGIPREGETPAQAFARQQEELAEKESRTPDSFLWRTQRGSWSDKQAPKEPERPGLWTDRQGKAQRFPSRDVWEDTPDSLQFTTTVSGPQSEREVEDEAAADEASVSSRPVVPPRPKKTGSGDSAKPVIPERPKPQVPARPAARQGSDPTESSEAAAKAKPAVPARPVGGKIAALQAGFMSDLNKRLQLGPQAPKKEEPVAADLSEEKEQAPLADARKGRARGPQRRAPTKSSSAGSSDKSTPPPVSHGKPVLSFSITHTLWSIDEEGTMVINPEEKEQEVSTVTEITPETPSDLEPKSVQPPTAKPSVGDQGEGDKVPVSPEQHEPEAASSEKPTFEESENKTLATNTAGESILQESVTKDPATDEIKAVEGTKEDVIRD
ncbi:altered inheritance of mitochondria protein 21 [Microdochium trichocladiopsis]|uniref:Altered inheritance of mitochondria protein 21 n=1 Tax=Microdochium trichocladiopsis TaxID=1682393 RepID=A0A9P8XVN8_9PEZI|nr:altered inheritance of mitochondria protein 21 [Microdochium trichocladiopsis]KAH7021020.1 altered inheritance of mitochondria protein 21 [Microdochium trichocladiopsis]